MTYRSMPLSRARRADSVMRWIEVKNRPIADPATGRFSRLVGVAIDITERKRTEQALRDSEESMRQLADGSSFTHAINTNNHYYIGLMIAVLKALEIVAVVFGKQLLYLVL